MVNNLIIYSKKINNLTRYAGFCRKKYYCVKYVQCNVDNLRVFHILLLLKTLKYDLSAEFSTLSTIFNKHCPEYKVGNCMLSTFHNFQIKKDLSENLVNFKLSVCLNNGKIVHFYLIMFYTCVIIDTINSKGVVLCNTLLVVKTLM